MHIEEKDSLEVYDFLRYERDRGMEWMLYGQENGKVTVANIFCFATQGEMNGFKQQYPAFAGNFRGANVDLVVESLAEKLEQRDELRPATVDIKVQAENRLYARQDKKPNGLLVKKHGDNNRQRQSHGIK